MTIEQSKNSTLSSTVEFCIKQEIKNNSINEWVSNPNLRKNLKIKIIQSTSPTATSELSKNINFNIVENNKVKVISDITIDDVLGGTTNYIQNNTSANTLSLRFRNTFSIENERPPHLSYFIFTYLETIKNKKQNGYILLQKVLNDGENINSEVQDFRHLENIKKTPINLTFEDNTLLSAQNRMGALKQDNMEPTRKPAYFSDIFLSRDRLSRAKFAFAVDFRKIIKDSSTFGSLYENIDKTKSSAGK